MKIAAQPLLSIETVTVGDAGNGPDANGYGSVGYRYRIGKHEVTVGQYAAFLNAAAKSDPYGLYNTNMALVSASSGIERSGTSGSYVYGVIGPAGQEQIPEATAANRPVTFVSWFDAARFANWMHNGATAAADTESGAYTLLGGQTNGSAPPRNPGATWWIPTENEWYKAAYYKGEGNGTNAGYWLYATQSDSQPYNFLDGGANNANIEVYSGGIAWLCVTRSTFRDNQNYLTDVGAFTNSPSAYGTFDQTGNVEEWNDLIGEGGSARGIRGGNWNIRQGFVQSANRATNAPSEESSSGLGFRLAAAASIRPTLPRIVSTSHGSNGFTLSWIPASDVYVQRRSSLNSGRWTTISRGVTNSSHTESAPPAGRAFYRLFTP